MDHHHTAEEERRIRDAAHDETLAESFPASDPPSTLPNPDDDTLLSDEGPRPPSPEAAPQE
jgi:hypothetical protein